MAARSLNAMSLIVLALIAIATFTKVSATDDSSSFITTDASPIPPNGIRVTTLGSGSPIVRRHQVASGFVIELGNGDKFIFDLGSGSYVNLVATDIPQPKLTKVFLSHLHSDHIADLASLYVGGAVYGRTEPWEVWGPSGETPEYGIKAAIQGLRQFLAWDKLARRRIDMLGRDDHGDEVIAHEFDSTAINNLIYDRNGVKVYSTPVKHYETIGPVALRLEWNGLTVTYSGDMRPNKEFEDLAAGSDLLLFQNAGPIFKGDISSLPYNYQYMFNTSHVIPEQAGPILSRLRPRLAVLHHLHVNDVTREHIITAVRKNYPEGEIHINEDLDVFEVTKEKITRKRWLVPDRSWGYLWHPDNNALKAKGGEQQVPKSATQRRRKL